MLLSTIHTTAAEIPVARVMVHGDMDAEPYVPDGEYGAKVPKIPQECEHKQHLKEMLHRKAPTFANAGECETVGINFFMYWDTI